MAFPLAPVFLLNSALKLAKTLAFVLLVHDARQSRVQGVSWKTVAFLALSSTLSFFNMESWYGWIPFKEWALTNLCGWAAAVSVYQKTNVRGMQDDILGAKGAKLPGWMRHAMPILMASAMSVVMSLLACGLSLPSLWSWVQQDSRGLLCTFQNFLHGTALLPQLMVSRYDHYVAPAAAKFLLFIGLLHIYEFMSDMGVSWMHYTENRLDFNEVSFLSGDLFAAAILMDFLYLVLTSKSQKEIVLHSSGLPFPV
mmetsp:Transcript_71725/g.134144  ORF Transcript_71725/g.134144 Transcript_71725/m.134144 type:complete len:254 (-) Transcript_71725:140-901(-)